MQANRWPLTTVALCVVIVAVLAMLAFPSCVLGQCGSGGCSVGVGAGISFGGACTTGSCGTGYSAPAQQWTAPNYPAPVPPSSWGQSYGAPAQVPTVQMQLRPQPQPQRPQQASGGVFPIICRVVVHLVNGGRIAFGSGVLVKSSPDGSYVATAAHGFDEPYKSIVVVFPSQKSFTATLCSERVESDVVLLRIAQPPLRAIAVATSIPPVGTDIYTGGFGDASGNLVWSHGQVVNHAAIGNVQSVNGFEVSGTSRNGDSGGPAVWNGYLCGIITAGDRGVVTCTSSLAILTLLAKMEGRTQGQMPAQAEPELPIPPDQPQPSCQSCTWGPSVTRELEKIDGRLFEAERRLDALDKLCASCGRPSATVLALQQQIAQLKVQLDAQPNSGSDQVAGILQRLSALESNAQAITKLQQAMGELTARVQALENKPAQQAIDVDKLAEAVRAKLPPIYIRKVDGTTGKLISSTPVYLGEGMTFTGTPHEVLHGSGSGN